MEIADLFVDIRDAPYRIPLFISEPDQACLGKHARLKEGLSKMGYTVRWRVCDFLWKSLPLPADLSVLPHEDKATHAYLEVLQVGDWQVVDATWDKPLANILPVNEWHQLGRMSIAVPHVLIRTPEESQEIIDSLNPEDEREDLEMNRAFFAGLNAWLQGIRDGVK